MAVSREQIVVDLDGVRGSIQEFAKASDGRSVARIELETGASVSVSSDLLHLEKDGGYSIPERWSQVVRESATGLELPVVHEHASVAVRRMHHRVRVRRKVITEQRTLETPVWTEDIQIERIPRDEFVQHMPEPHQDGDALVIPVIEQVAVVETRLRLREEIRIRVVRRENVDRRTIAVRRHEVKIDREGEPPASPPHSNVDDKRRTTMKTIIAAFGARDAAAQAMTDIRNHPYHLRSLWMVDDPRDSAKLMRDFEQRSVPREWADLYTEASRRGATIVVGDSDDREAEEIAALLEQHGTLNLERSAARWKGDEAWAGYRADQPGLDDARLAAERQKLESESIPVVEEKVHVGKRETPGETVRVRTFVTERPVHEEVKLREEHVDVSHEPANERISPAAAERQFKEEEHVVTTTSEVPVVEKEARVVERVKVEKQADTRTAAVDETERRREVETERIPPATEPPRR